MAIADNIEAIKNELKPYHCRLIVVSKTRTLAELEQVYAAGHKAMAENRVQELLPKYEALPKDIEWHIIGHLQTNKVKYIAPFIACIHSVDTFKLLEEINRQAAKHNRVIPCLLQIYIAKEETKFGLEPQEALQILQSSTLTHLKNITIIGLMGMATFTDKEAQIHQEFASLKSFFDSVKHITQPNVKLTELSMGMSSDYKIALQHGSTMVRVGSAVFK